MTKTRILIGLAGALTLLAITAIPAEAWFEGLSGGTGHGTAGESTLTGGGAVATCTSIEGGYEVWSKASTKNGTELIQSPANPGPHILITASKWNTCTVEVGGKKLVGTVSPCKFLGIQESKGSTSGIGSLASECVATTGSCVAKAPVTAANENLAGITLTNNGTSLEANISLSGVTINVNAACKALGIASTTSGSIKTTLTGVNLREV